MSRFLSFLAMALMSLMLFYTVGDLPVLFDPRSPASNHVSPRYIEKSAEEAGSPNFVTAVLADYRGYDTLGETTVIFTAGLATALLLRSYSKKAHRLPKGRKSRRTTGNSGWKVED